METQFTRLVQAKMWAWGFAAFVASCVYCAVKQWRSHPMVTGKIPAAAPKPAITKISVSTKLLWVLLPACASILLLATTNKLCQDIAVMPFLWILPLALYLLSFILSFDNSRWYVRSVFGLGLIAALGAVCWALYLETDAPLYWQVGIYLGALFICCVVCHGELYRLRPDPQQLTAFYLLIAAGGALGGLFVAVVAPRIFADYYEMHWGLLLCGLLFIIICLRDNSATALKEWRWLAGLLTLAIVVGLDRGLVALGRNYPDVVAGQLTAMRVGWWGAVGLVTTLWVARRQYRTFTHWRFLACFWLVMAWVILATALWFQARDFAGRILVHSRNFYGTLKVSEYRTDEPESHYYQLEHGRITHGLQFAHPDHASWPTTYYGAASGLALALDALPKGPRRIGSVGLGTGTTATFGRKGDVLRIYEINPDVIHLAETRFTYLSNSAARIEMVLGDARLSLEHEPPQQFDLLALDAFSSDAIPVHLLTKEAFELYGRHLNTNGVIAVHISNRYLDLEPVLRNVATHFNYELAKINYEENEAEEGAWWVYSSTWILLTRNHELLDQPAIRNAATPVNTNAPRIRLWTDDFASIFQVLE